MIDISNEKSQSVKDWLFSFSGYVLIYPDEHAHPSEGMGNGCHV